MLPRAHRMVDPADFIAAIRHGARAGDPLVVVHVRADEERNSRLVGFVVPKREIKRASGRNRVKRQLRNLMRGRIEDLPEGCRVVVRASSQALGVPSKELGSHLDRVMRRAWRKWDAR
ncbi:ribonuclease P [Schaalia meyeri]|uniref:Ribonuclease P protein component n=1 Tax=Schaalia meyeri TaxID=52773 RepID=A0AAP9Y8K9_9ACTO|nr:ribonuclease P protein component [Schaalia meyeri]AKU65637.1 ribonuclease P [Schaalia meyeri]OFQ22814.1 ribonuclease P protein component [Actinomyces sp. HMSC062G12]QQC43653.1 ribonuclease P protein component [Schaalia meyeri]SDS18396.1 ribonuclease P protein component [Schaalia meyeri]